MFELPTPLGWLLRATLLLSIEDDNVNHSLESGESKKLASRSANGPLVSVSHRVGGEDIEPGHSRSAVKCFNHRAKRIQKDGFIKLMEFSKAR